MGGTESVGATGSTFWAREAAGGAREAGKGGLMGGGHQRAVWEQERLVDIGGGGAQRAVWETGSTFWVPDLADDSF